VAFIPPNVKTHSQFTSGTMGLRFFACILFQQFFIFDAGLSKELDGKKNG